MFNYTVELQLWACNRMINDYVIKIDYFERRRAEFEGRAALDGIKTDSTIRSNRALVVNVNDEINRYRECIRKAMRISNDIYLQIGSLETFNLDNRIMRDAFIICGSQRLIKYATVLGWSREYTREVSLRHSDIMRVHDIIISPHTYAVIHQPDLSARALRMIAVHGGMHCELDHRIIYNNMTSGIKT